MWKGGEVMANILWKAYFGVKRAVGRKEQGMGVIEIILIIVVLISLVLIFKSQLTSLVKEIFQKISSQARSV